MNFDSGGGSGARGGRVPSNEIILTRLSRGTQGNGSSGLGHPFGSWPSDFHEAIFHRLRSSSDGGHDPEQDRRITRRET